MHRLTIFIIFLVISPSLSFSMNDTNGVVNIGLFPIDPSSNLEILSEINEIVIKAKGLAVIKNYKIKNSGKTNDFEFGTMFCYNCLSKPQDFKVSVNGKTIALKEQSGYLIDSGGYVKVDSRSQESIAKRLKNLDGNIVGHSWGSFKINIKSNDVVNVELRYFESHASENLAGNVLSKLSIYTEKFWSGKTVPSIEFILSAENNIVPINKFITDGSYDSIEPDTILDDKLIWSFKNYAPRKEMYTYSYQFIHPYSIECKDICETFNKNTGAKMSCARCF
jgi:hypothetical protein